jgi:chorismate synthase
MPGRESARKALEEIEKLRQEGDSSGCLVSCLAGNLPPGLGEPVFDKLDARLAAAMLSLGAANGVEFGAGFAAAGGCGSKLNDPPIPVPEAPRREEQRGKLPPGVPPAAWKTNNSGGILGGLSNGADLFFTVAFKPISSIMQKQETINRRGERAELLIQGRHDVCVGPRAVSVVEAMCALVLADFILLQRSARI